MKREQIAVAAGLTAALSLLPAPAGEAQRSPRYQLRVHAIFSGGQSSGLRAGQPLQVQFIDRRHRVRETRICWSPAPIAKPACGVSAFGAPARAGIQRITVRLSNGRSLSTRLRIGRAATRVNPSGASTRPAVPLEVTCRTPLFGNLGRDGRGATPLGTLDQSDMVAAYYRANRRLTQVWAYAKDQAGFARTACLRPMGGGS